MSDREGETGVCAGSPKSHAFPRMSGFAAGPREALRLLVGAIPLGYPFVASAGALPGTHILNLTTSTGIPMVERTAIDVTLAGRWLDTDTVAPLMGHGA